MPISEQEEFELLSLEREKSGAKSPESSLKQIPGQLGALAKKAKTAAERVIAQQDPDVDYKGLDDIKVQAAYSLIDKPEDKTTYLKQAFGEKNVGKDSFGRDYVIQNGKKIAVKPATSETPFAVGAAAKVGDVLPVAGMIAGGAAGATISAPVLGSAAVPGAALGGAAGTAYNKIISKILGLPTSEASG